MDSNKKNINKNNSLYTKKELNENYMIIMYK